NFTSMEVSTPLPVASPSPCNACPSSRYCSSGVARVARPISARGAPTPSRNRGLQFQEHYHEERNHRVKNNVLLFPAPAPLEPGRGRGMRCRERLGGLLGY